MKSQTDRGSFQVGDQFTRQRPPYRAIRGNPDVSMPYRYFQPKKSHRCLFPEKTRTTLQKDHPMDCQAIKINSGPNCNSMGAFYFFILLKASQADLCLIGISQPKKRYRCLFPRTAQESKKESLEQPLKQKLRIIYEIEPYTQKW